MAKYSYKVNYFYSHREDCASFSELKRGTPTLNPGDIAYIYMVMAAYDEEDIFEDYCDTTSSSHGGAYSPRADSSASQYISIYSQVQDVTLLYADRYISVVRFSIRANDIGTASVYTLDCTYYPIGTTTFAGCGNNNYVVHVEKAYIYINPPKLNATPNFTYDGTVKNILESGYIDNYDSVHVELSNYSATNAGEVYTSYAIKSSYLDTYRFNSGDGTGGNFNWEIKKANPILTGTNSVSTYPNFAAGKIKASVPGTVTYTTSTDSTTKTKYITINSQEIIRVDWNSPVGTISYAYISKFVPDDTGNYNTLSSTTPLVTVSAKVGYKGTPTITPLAPDAISFSAGAQTTNLTATATGGGDVSFVSSTLTVTDNSGKSYSDWYITSSGQLTIPGNVHVADSPYAITVGHIVSETDNYKAITTSVLKTYALQIVKAPGYINIDLSDINYQSPNHITKIPIQENVTLTYDGDIKYPVWTDYDSSIVTIFGGISNASDAGTYSRKAQLSDINYFEGKSMSRPMLGASGNVTYSVNSSDVIVTKDSSSGLNISIIHVGNCVIMANVEESNDYLATSAEISVKALAGQYVWPDNKHDIKDISWTIQRADQVITTTSDTYSVGVGGIIHIVASTSGDGTLSFESNKTNVATVDSKYGTVTGQAIGTAGIKIIASATNNYNKADKTVTVNVSKQIIGVTISPVLFTYDGTRKAPNCHFDPPIVNSSGTLFAYDAGKYNITFTIQESYRNAYVFENGESAMTVDWEIEKANTIISTTNPSAVRYSVYDRKVYLVASANSGGTITFATSCIVRDKNDNPVITWPILSNGQLTIPAKTSYELSPYSISVKISASETNNYKAVNSESHTFRLEIDAQETQTWPSLVPSSLNLHAQEAAEDIQLSGISGDFLAESSNLNVAHVAIDFNKALGNAVVSITGIGAGQCMITLSASGSDTYAPASKQINITVGRLTPTWKLSTEKVTISSINPTAKEVNLIGYLPTSISITPITQLQYCTWYYPGGDGIRINAKNPPVIGKETITVSTGETSEYFAREQSFTVEIMPERSFKTFTPRINTASGVKSAQAYVVIKDPHGNLVWRKATPYINSLND